MDGSCPGPSGSEIASLETPVKRIDEQGEDLEKADDEPR
jgi:hypothetical protein